LNEDLTEAISLGHDLGHTPFGHAGERALNGMIPGGFRHYEQSVRVVEKLEKDGKGLNLTKEVRDGILCHTRGKEASTLEGRIVKISDRIAYINHDIDDAQRAGVLLEKEIPEKAVKVLGASRTARINTLVHSLVENSRGGELAMEPRVQEAFDELHAFMYEHVYHNPCAKGEEKKVPELVEQLFDFFMNNPQRLPDQMQLIAYQEGLVRAVCDHVAGMTDHFAVQTFTSIYIPNSWTS
jgi:dGTPase